MKRILVPVDFSEFSIEALKVAAQIAKKHSFELILLHVLELPNLSGDTFSAQNSVPEIIFFKNKAIEKLEELMDEPFLEGISVLESIEFRSISEGVLDCCKVNHVDLIVMGTHGSSGFKEVFIGSNTEKIVRSSEVPVLVIKRGQQDFSVKHIVVASDFSDASKVAFSKMLVFAKLFQSKLSLVNVSTPSSFNTTVAYEELSSGFVKDFSINNFSTHSFNDISIERGVLTFASVGNADLIFVFTHGRSGLSRFYNGSIAAELVNHAALPVMTFKL